MQRLGIRVRGIVQGVGFRPFIYRLARQYGLCGYVLNDAEGVWIEAQGDTNALEKFLTAIAEKAPPASSVISVTAVVLPPLGSEVAFAIRESRENAAPTAFVSPDIAICADCRREIADRADRRHRYAFTNCTNCGPRYSITRGVPYDRVNTTMDCFSLCASCRSEYEDPMDRRFHAQPNACHDCGPAYMFLDGQGCALPGDALREAKRLLAQGAILAVKGIGGYHFACDARREDAVARLRRRKRREEKPLAVMCGGLTEVKRLCGVSSAEAALLEGAAHPIVLLAKGEKYDLATSVAPGNAYLGVMLPYAPVHCLLLDEADVWVMTSANASDEPIAYEDADALVRLAGIADAFLVHNRRIYCRVDDSVARVFRGAPYLLRRSRGMAPAPIRLARSGAQVLAAGGELKNTFCLTKGAAAFVGAHIGDLENAATLASYRAAIEHDQLLFGVMPEIAACDLHPEYLSTKFAQALMLPLVKVQHHHAHIASVLAEHGEVGSVIGVAFDGSGYGADGCLWGGEFLLADLRGYRRLGHCRYLPLPGGAKAIREPWRLAAWVLWEAQEMASGGEHFLLRQFLPEAWELAMQAAAQGLNAPLSSSIGRLFDAAAALLGIKGYNAFEGQAAVLLEQAAHGITGEVLPYAIAKTEMFVLDLRPALIALARRAAFGESVGYLAASFHETVAVASSDMIRRIAARTGVRTVALSGGVFQNLTLLARLINALEGEFTVLLNRQVPPNDGGLSLGQAAVAAERSG